MYFFCLSPYNNEKSFRCEDGRMFDSDPTNSDYQQYLAWVAEGNTAEEWSPNASE